MEHKKRIKIIENSWRKRYKEFDEIFDFNKNLAKNGKHLDFGCGFGAFLSIISEKFPNVIFYGQDINVEEIDIGRELYKSKNINFICSEKIIGKYDSISVFFTFYELVGNIEDIIKKLYNVLEKNGKIFVYDYRKVSKRKFKDYYEKTFNKEKSFEKVYKEHNKWSVNEFEKTMKKVGFKTIKIKSHSDFWFYYIGEK